MEMKFSRQDIIKEVERSISIIGKRAVDANGNRLFSVVTLGSAEKGLLSDYVDSAVVNIAAATREFFEYKICTCETDSTDTTTETTTEATDLVEFGFRTDADANLSLPLSTACQKYIVGYCLYSWFTVVQRHLAEKYLAECTAALTCIVSMLRHREKPSVYVNPLTGYSSTITE